MAKSKIPWTEQTLNVTTGCWFCSPGCWNCYALKQSHRLAAMGQHKYQDVTEMTGAGVQWSGVVKCWPEELQKPIRNKKPTIYFIDSMSDLFHPKVPFEFVQQVMNMIKDCPHHTFQILTKRALRMAKYFSVWEDWPYSKNLLFGVSICTQEELYEKASILQSIHAHYRFISFEPLLEMIDAGGYFYQGINRCDQCHWYGEDDESVEGPVFPCPQCGSETYALPIDEEIDQIIIGCERKHGNIAGRFQEGFINAARQLIRQAAEAGVKVFVKQIPINGKVFTDMKRFPKEL